MQPSNALQQLFHSPYLVVDPGASGTITIDRQFAVVPVVTAAAEARTLAQPTKAGLICTVVVDTYVGDLTLTVTGGWKQAGTTTITFDTAGDWVQFLSVKVGSSYYWRVLAEEGTNAAESITSFVAAAATVTNMVVASNITALTGVYKSINCSTGMTAAALTAPSIVATSAMSLNSLLGTNASVGAMTVTGNRVLGCGTVQVSGGTAAVDTQATALLSPTLNLISVGTSTNNYFKLPTAAKNICCNIVNLGSTAGIVGHTAGVSIASATSVALATANASGSAVNLVCDGTNWWHRAIA